MMACAIPSGVLPTELSSVLGAGHAVIYLNIVNKSKGIYERANTPMLRNLNPFKTDFFQAISSQPLL